jgi:hypothetical protein
MDQMTFADYVEYEEGRGTALELSHGGYMAVWEVSPLVGPELEPVGPYTLIAVTEARFGFRAQAELELVAFELDLDDMAAACD